jgi:uncharacterized protein (TIGR03435 family)
MNFKARIYALIVAMHPASFRHEFGLEMRLDFEEARESHGVMGLYWDALSSAFRQWGRAGVMGERERVPAAARFLLEGRYGAIDGDGLSAFEFGRGTVLAVGLFGGLVLLQGRAVAHSSNDFASPNYSASDGFQPETARHTPANGARSQAGPGTSRPSYRSGPIQQAEVTPQDSAAIRSHFVRPLRISETVAAREIARTEAAQRVASGAASVGTAVPREPETPAGTGVSGHARVAGQILHATAPLPSFEVVSIRLWHRPPLPASVVAGLAAGNQPGARPTMIKIDPGSGGPRAVTSPRVHFIIPGDTLIATAYGLPVDSGRIVGAPGWLRQDDPQFEITAKIGDDMFAEMQKMSPAEQQTQMKLMEQSLLADRFALKLHSEQREMPMFALEVAKGGARLTPAAEGTASRLSNIADGGLKGTAVSLDQLAASPLLLGGRVVVNRTGLTGAYDFTVRYSGESGDGDSPGLYTAIQQQLGLRLVPTKGTVEVLVIDAVEKPSEN